MIDRFLRSYWVSKGLIVLASQLSSLVFGFVNFYLLLRVLTKFDYGVWTLFISVLTFFELIKNGFIISPLVRYLIGSDDKEQETIKASSFVLNCLIGLIQIVIAIIVSFVIGGELVGGELGYLLIMMICGIILGIPLTHFNAVQQAHMNFRANLASNLTRQFLFFFVVLYLYFLSSSPSLSLLGIGYLFSVLLSAFVAYFQSRQYGPFSFAFSRDWLSKLSVYGKFTFGTNISSMVLRSVDTWLIGALLSPAAVTIYNPAIRIANIIEVPTVSLSSVFFPKLLSRYTNEGNAVAKELYEKSVGALLAVLLPIVIVIILFAEPIIWFVAGEGFEETVDILRVTMLTGLIIPFNRQIGVMLDAVGKAKVGFRFVLRNAIINIVLCYFFINQFGIIGASYAMLCTFVFSFIYNQWYISREYQIKLSNAIRYTGQYYRISFQKVSDLLKGKASGQ